MKTKYQFSCVSSQFDVLWLFLVTLGLTCGVETTRLKERRLEVFIFLVEVNDILLLH